MSEFAKTACCRCREQKVKCTKELPKCARCSRVNTVCIFPDPPDRKLLATYRVSHRADSKKRRTSEAPLGAADLSPSSSISNGPPSSFTALLSAAEGAFQSQKGPCAEINSQLPQTLRHFLIDVYFTHMYNAWLLFHRPTLLANISSDLVPAHVLVSIYATATIFLPPTTPLAQANAKILQPLGDLQALGKQWASQAGREALVEIIDPNLTTIQTCQILALFWFSVGNSRKNTMFSGIAYKAACVFGLNSSAPVDPATETTDTYIKEETKRRVFWATWLTNCINSEHYTVGTSVNDRILSLPLPINDMSFANGVRVPLTTTYDAEKLAKQSPESSHSQPSLMAELVKLMMIWAAIGDYLEARKHQSSRDSLIPLFDLDSRLSLWERSLHPAFSYSKRNLYKQLIVEQQPAFIFINALYHQCRLVLHSSMVPQFSGLSTDESISTEIINVSARTALKAAQSISELGSDLIALDWEISRIAPFVGYCTYCSASIHIVFLFSQNEALSALAKKRLVSNLNVLCAMKDYWSNLERLWARIQILYEAQTARLKQNQNFSSQGPSIGKPDLNEHDSETTELETIEDLALKQRDIGRLEEPLATSVLEYSLRLKPSQRGSRNQNSLSDLERKIYNDPLTRIADRESLRQKNLKMHGQSQDQGREGVSIDDDNGRMQLGNQIRSTSGLSNISDHMNLSSDYQTTTPGFQQPGTSLSSANLLGGNIQSEVSSTTGLPSSGIGGTGLGAGLEFQGFMGGEMTEQMLNSMLPSFLQEGGDDWWQSDLDMLAQEMRNHNHLFGVDS